MGKKFPFAATVAASLFLASFLFVLVSQRDVGIARDEATYMHYGSRYADWWMGVATGKIDPTSRTEIRSHFGGVRPTDGNREHPPLMKTLFGLSHALFYDSLHWTSEQTAFRLPSALMFALLVVMVYSFARHHFGGITAAVASALVLFTPRLFFHASMATFDVAVVTLWFATLFVYDRALRSERAPVAVAIVFGLALATKHNALMLPAVVGGHYLWVAYRDVAGSRGGVAVRLRSLGQALWNLRPSILLAFLFGGPLVLVALWPWLWFEPLDHFAQWIGFHLDHVHYNYEYLGSNLNAPPFPWHIAIVTVLFTVPAVTLVASAMGVGDCIRRYRAGERREDGPAMLLGLSAAVAIGPFLLPSTPVFGAEKHYAAVVPSLCIFAGIGVRESASLLTRCLPRLRAHYQLAAAVLAVLVIAAAAAETRSAQPYGLSHYTSLAGGPGGAAELGMNRQFWGYAARGVLDELAQRVDGQGPVRVYTHDASPAWPWYRRFGLLDKRLVDAGPERQGVRRSQFAIVVHEKHFNRHDYMIWDDYGTVQPIYVLTYAGVPLVSVYERPVK